MLSTPRSVTASAPIHTIAAWEISSGSAASTTSQVGMPASASSAASARPSFSGRLSATSTRGPLPLRCSSSSASRTAELEDSVAIHGSRMVASWAAVRATAACWAARSSRSAAQDWAMLARRSGTASPRATPVEATSSARTASWWIKAIAGCAA